MEHADVRSTKLIGPNVALATGTGSVTDCVTVNVQSPGTQVLSEKYVFGMSAVFALNVSGAADDVGTGGVAPMVAGTAGRSQPTGGFHVPVHDVVESGSHPVLPVIVTPVFGPVLLTGTTPELAVAPATYSGTDALIVPLASVPSMTVSVWKPGARAPGNVMSPVMTGYVGVPGAPKA
jgi:hypothetical protein